MRKITEIIVHCSATPAGKDFTVDDIRRWHVDDNGWSDIGYHYVIYRDGSVHEGRPVSKIGAHVAGHNRYTIGVCYIGGVDANDVKKARDTRTPAQRRALEALLVELLNRFPSINKISGHHDYAAKACPSFPARAEYARLLDKPTGTRKPLAKSNTVKGGLTGGALGVGNVADGIMGTAATASGAQARITSGDWIQIAIGVGIVAVCAYIIYRRWDDAGRPSLSKITDELFNRMTPADA